MVLVTQNAPNFIAPAVLENGDITEEFNFKNYSHNQPVILFFWPMDFTFVCPSEIIELNKLYPEFTKRNVKVVGVSIDSVFVHKAWQNTLPKNGGIGKICFPMISDIKHNIQQSYGIEHPKLGVALRAVFLIDSNSIIRHQIVNDLPFGRNMQEIIRMIDALDFYNKFGEVCPANWIKGKQGIKASSEGIAEYLSKYY